MSSALICDEVTGHVTGDSDDSELTTFLQKFTLSKVANINPTAVFCFYFKCEDYKEHLEANGGLV